MKINISSMVSESIHKTEWYQHTPKKFDLVQNYNHVQAICGDDPACYMDSFNWTVMNKTELTSDIYKLISDRMAVIKEGFQNNFLPEHVNFHALLDLIDWHFILDCISWFL